MTVGQLIAVLGLDSKEYQDGLRRAGIQTEDFVGKVDSASFSVQRFGSALSGLGAGLTAAVSVPLAGVAVAALKVASNMEQAEIGFKALTGSAQAGMKLLGELKQLALTTPFEFPDLLVGARRLLAMGFEAGKVTPALKAIGAAAAALGGSGKESIDRITLALGQMRLSTVKAQDMNQLIQAGIDGWGMLAKAAGKSVAEIKDLSEKGALSGAAAVEIILAGMQEKFGKLQEDSAKSLQVMWTNVLDQVTFTLAEIGKSMLPVAKMMIRDWIEPALARVRELSAAFSALDPTTQKWYLGLAGAVGAGGPILLGMGLLAGQVNNLITLFQQLARVQAISAAFAFGGKVALLAGGAAILGATGYAAYRLGQELEKLAVGGEKSSVSLQRLSGVTLDLGPATRAADLGLAEFSTTVTASGEASAGAGPLITGMAEHVRKTGGAFAQSRDIVGTWSIQLWKAAQAANAQRAALQDYRISLVSGQMAEDAFAVSAKSVTAETVGLVKPLNQAKTYMDLLTISVQQALEPWKKTQDAMKRLNTAAHDQQDELEVLAADLREVQDAYLAGARSAEEMTEAEDDYAAAVARVNKRHHEAKGPMKEVSTILTNMNQDIARLIVNWKGWGDTAVSIAKRIGEALIADVIRNLILTESRMKAVSKAIGSVLSKIPGLGGVFGGTAGGVAGGAAGGAGSAAGGAVGGVAGGAGGAGASAAGAVASGAMGIVGAVAGVATAVSSIIGNFQMHGMNKALDRIVLHTLQTANDLSNLRADAWDRETHLMHKLDDIWATLLRTQDALWPHFDMLYAHIDALRGGTFAAASAGGGGELNINIRIEGGSVAAGQQAAEEVVRYLEARGVGRAGLNRRR